MRLVVFLVLVLLTEPHPTCRTVAHIGDSTSVGMMSDRLGSGDTLDAQYARVGAKSVIHVAGGRSLREHRRGRENGVQVAKRLRASGFAGCWVIALGTNDAANVARGGGGARSMTSRVTAMMDVIGSDPVMWVDAVTVGASGWYTDAGMIAWGVQLELTLATYPHARIYRWSEVARREWFQRDGIHYTRSGYTARARMTADAFAAALL